MWPGPMTSPPPGPPGPFIAGEPVVGGPMTPPTPSMAKPVMNPAAPDGTVPLLFTPCKRFK